MKTVIRDNDENRVLGMWRGLQRIPHPAEMIVAMAQCGIIVAYALLPPLFLRGVDILQENLVRVSIGVEAPGPFLGHPEGLLVIHFLESRGCIMRTVGTIEAHLAIERSAGRAVLQELDRGIGRLMVIIDIVVLLVRGAPTAAIAAIFLLLDIWRHMHVIFEVLLLVGIKGDCIFDKPNS